MISLILPAYNCYPELFDSLPRLVKKLRESGINFEIILVDDFSQDSDSYGELAESNQCVYIKNKKNYGKGYSVRLGFSKAKGSILIFMDGDFPFDLDVIDQLIENFDDDKKQIVIGDRSLEHSVFPSVNSRIRAWGSKILSFVTKRIITPGLSDTQCGIKGFRKDVVENIFPFLTVNGFSFDMEVLFVAIRKKYRIDKIPVRAKKQNSSHVRVLYHGTEMIFNIAGIYCRYWLGLYRI